MKPKDGRARTPLSAVRFLGGLLLSSALSAGIAAESGSKPEEIRYAGSVLDRDGKPVAEATVELYQFGRSFPAAGGSMTATATNTTAANGTYEFRAPASGTVIFAKKAGLAPAWASYWNPQSDVTDERLVLTIPASIHGSVVDDTDNPVADALVFITAAYAEIPTDGGGTRSAYLSTMPSRDQFSARSGPDGKFRIDGCPTNAAMDLGVRKAGKVLREPRRQYVSPETMRCRPGKGEVKLVLEQAGTVEGKVRSEKTGQPLAGARISFQRQGEGSFSVPEPVASGPDGNFRLNEVGAGSYRVHAAFGTNEIPDLVAETIAVNVEAGKTTRDIEITATKGGFLEVAALGKEDRLPVPQVSISVYKEGYHAGQATGSNGLALLRLPAGSYQLSGYRDNSRSEQVSASVAAGATNRAEIQIARPLTLSGRVRDPAGAAVPGLQLRVLPTYRANVGLVKTDSEGRFEFAWNPRAVGGQNTTCCIVARDVNRNLAVAQDLEEGTTKLDLQLAPGLTIAGQVQDKGGKPLAEATVNLYLWTGNSGDSFLEKPIQMDSKGSFEVTALPADRRYSVNVRAKGYGSGDSQIQSGDAETARLELPVFTLNVADREVAGQVVDADDKPVSGAWVHSYGNGQPNASLRTDDQGRFRFEACEGRLHISASTQGSYGNISADAGETNVILKLGVNMAYSVVETPQRAPLKGKPLPSLATVGLAPDCAPAGKPILLCLFDLEQRPCRRFTRLLAEQYDTLRQKGLTVLALQAALTSDEAFEEWKTANSPPFQVGRLAEKKEQLKWASEVESMPWLILTDKERHVIAEGFPFEELEAKLKESGK